MPFRKTDMRRVQAAFDATVDAPYEAEITLAPDALKLSVVVRDPEDDGLTVAQCFWDFDTAQWAKTKTQPADGEIAYMADAFKTICLQYEPPAPPGEG